METNRVERIGCFRCRLYDRIGRRCTVGKVNPRTKLDTYEVVQVLGARALCSFNLYRDQIVSAVAPDRNGKRR
ncbi:MAG: hypothetical protein HPY54_01415 [Chthonomonadetes bacterium]|nr:hypothetical protein [Chthonomonadetes bacterium]